MNGTLRPVLTKAHHRIARDAGFTLLEILVVVTLMVVMISAFNMSNQPTASQKVSGAHAVVGTLLREARITALMRLNKVRLLVHDDDQQPYYKRRSIAIVAETEPDSGQWRLIGTPELLPQGVLWVALNDGGHRQVQAPEGIGAWDPGSQCLSYEYQATGRISGLRYTFGVGPGSVMADDGFVLITNPRDVLGWTVTAYGLAAQVTNVGRLLNVER